VLDHVVRLRRPLEPPLRHDLASFGLFHSLFEQGLIVASLSAR